VQNGTLAGVMEMSPSRHSPRGFFLPLICRKRTEVQETDKSRVHRCNDFFPHPEVGGIARPEYFPTLVLARQDGQAGIFSLIAVGISMTQTQSIFIIVFWEDSTDHPENWQQDCDSGTGIR